ncbi:MAG: dGTP triphosphohydrolase [Microcystaceae cyanobacterium]
MQWQQLLTPKRLGKTYLEDHEFERTPSLKDYDRLVYSGAFRRLKDKTQVFPLSKTEEIRTRLVHSLEVSCVGRSLGRIVGYQIIKRHQLTGLTPADFGEILSAACLAHDIGNPPFGHSGEDAMGMGFEMWYGLRHSLKQSLGLNFSEKQDFSLFEGNAQGFRILTRLEMPHRHGGMQLTCPTLAAFTKYPRESYIPDDILGDYQGKSVKKFGFFQADKTLFAEVAETVGLIRRHPQVAWWARHPLTFLVEAADDICYLIIDLEDGFRMGYIPFDKAKFLLNEIANISLDNNYTRPEEIIKRLRAKAINQLVQETAKIFLDYETAILAGTFDQDLLSQSRFSEILSVIEQTEEQLIFHHPDVVGLKVAGYEILGGLFTEFVNGIIHNTKKGELLIYLIPPEFRPQPDETLYIKLLKITDYISGMTDFQATKMFQKLKGISL